MSNITAKVTLPSGALIKATVNTAASQITTNNPVTLQTTKANRLDQMVDVVEEDLVDGATLVYRASDDKYILKTPDVDGGSF